MTTLTLPLVWIPVSTPVWIVIVSLGVLCALIGMISSLFGEDDE